MENYTQDIDGCLKSASGVGLEAADFEAYLRKAEGGLERLRHLYESGELPLLRLPEARKDLALLEPVAEELRSCGEDIVFLGTGGSSLGAQALGQLAGFGIPGGTAASRFHFFDNLDPLTLEAFLDGGRADRAHFVVVSKSGSTAETIIQLLSVFGALDARAAAADLASRFVVITEPGEGVLRKIAEARGLRCFDHDPLVGGRYSVLSNVGLLPAMVMGLDAVKVREGAASVFAPILGSERAEDIAPAAGAALACALADKNGVTTNVLLSYSDQLRLLGNWYAQLWAESLGKEGKGTTPFGALGPVDQHSQLQLYLGGPNDKFHTVIMTDCQGRGPRIGDALPEGDERLAYLAGKSIGDLVHSQQRATADTLIGNGRPTRIMKVGTIDECSLGAFMMHFMLETIIGGSIWGVDPFDQPAVEEGKVLARQYLGEMK